jgi:cell division protein FtsB
VSRAVRARRVRSARKRLLIVLALVLVVVVGIMANVKPLAHYRDASARLDKATAKVSDLQAQASNLQSKLAKLSETGYMEALAREKLTYAKPGEDLYIVTPDPNDASGSTADSTTNSAAGSGDASDPSDTDGVSSATDSQSRDHPGILERVITAIRGVF